MKFNFLLKDISMSMMFDLMTNVGIAVARGSAERGVRYDEPGVGVGDLSGGMSDAEKLRRQMALEQGKPDPKVIAPQPEPQPQPQPLVEPAPQAPAPEPAFNPLKGDVEQGHAPLQPQPAEMIVDPSAPLPRAGAPTQPLDVSQLAGQRGDLSWFEQGVNRLVNGINALLGLPMTTPEQVSISATNFALSQRGIPLHIGADGNVHLSDDAVGGSMLPSLLMEMNRPGALDGMGYSAIADLPLIFSSISD